MANRVGDALVPSSGRLGRELAIHPVWATRSTIQTDAAPPRSMKSALVSASSIELKRVSLSAVLGAVNVVTEKLIVITIPHRESAADDNMSRPTPHSSHGAVRLRRAGNYLRWWRRVRSSGLALGERRVK